MLILPTLADRVWFAYHCLPREADGQPPSYRELEARFALPAATFSRTVSGERIEHRRKTFERLALALSVTTHWLDHGGDDGPVPTGPVPPRPGTSWMCHGQLPGWSDVVARLRAQDGGPPVPLAAIYAGENMVVLRLVDFVTPELVTNAASYMWSVSTRAEKSRYEARAIAEEAAEEAARRAAKPLRRVAK